jgi:hypothetical protein
MNNEAVALSADGKCPIATTVSPAAGNASETYDAPA